MNIISLKTQNKKKISSRLFDLTVPDIIFIDIDISSQNSSVTYDVIEVEEQHEMRVDLLFRDMYNLQPNEANIYLGNIDVILSINNIDNPLNIKKGMILKFPRIDEFPNFRVSPDGDPFNKKNNTSVRDKLTFPNKKTRKDGSRENFKDSGYSLPPVVLRKPKKPVNIIRDGDEFIIAAGGLG